jgi:hypothetical protein
MMMMMMIIIIIIIQFLYEHRASPGFYAACSGKFPTDVPGQPVGPIFKG